MPRTEPSSAPTKGSEVTEDQVPEQLMPLSWLIGKWVGVGLGTYPGIEDFRFGQEVSFATDGRPFLQYASRSWILNDEGEQIRPSAMEVGFWRPQADNHVEVLLTHSTGILETMLGTVEITNLESAAITGARIQLHTDVAARTETAKEYSAGSRLYGLIEGDLGYAFDMAAMGHEMQNHLSARLAKVG